MLRQLSNTAPWPGLRSVLYLRGCATKCQGCLVLNGGTLNCNLLSLAMSHSSCLPTKRDRVTFQGRTISTGTSGSLARCCVPNATFPDRLLRFSSNILTISIPGVSIYSTISTCWSMVLHPFLDNGLGLRGSTTSVSFPSSRFASFDFAPRRSVECTC